MAAAIFNHAIVSRSIEEAKRPPGDSLGRAREIAEIMSSFIDAFRRRISAVAYREGSIGSWDGLADTDIDAWPGRLNGCSGYGWFFRAPDGES